MKKLTRQLGPLDPWSQTLLGSYSDFKVKFFEPSGEFGWHVHEDCDELFVALEGEFTIKLKNQDIPMRNGDSYLVPAGVEHTTASNDKASAIVVRSFKRE